MSTVDKNEKYVSGMVATSLLSKFIQSVVEGMQLSLHIQHDRNFNGRQQ